MRSRFIFRIYRRGNCRKNWSRKFSFSRFLFFLPFFVTPYSWSAIIFNAKGYFIANQYFMTIDFLTVASFHVASDLINISCFIFGSPVIDEIWSTQPKRLMTDSVYVCSFLLNVRVIRVENDKCKKKRLPDWEWNLVFLTKNLYGIETPGVSADGLYVNKPHARVCHRKNF